MTLRPLTSILTLLALGACAHAPAEPAPSPHPVKETPAMAAPPASGPGAAPIQPRLSAEEVLTRLLDLIRSSKSIKDFTPERLHEVTGMTIEYAKDGSERYGFGEQLTSDWSYGFGVDKSLPQGPRFELGFNETVPGTSPPMTDICQIDFEKFASELKSMGFTREPYYDSAPPAPPGEERLPHGRLFYWTFYRPELGIQVYPRGEANEPHEKISHDCVQMVLIT